MTYHQHIDERSVRMDSSPLKAALADVVAIPVTPFGPDGNIDENAHRALIGRLLDGGVRILTPNGNTGEFYALTGAAQSNGVDDRRGR
jgi:4-hydroxy-tetrahydrodipicolinate synthase